MKCMYLDKLNKTQKVKSFSGEIKIIGEMKIMKDIISRQFILGIIFV